MGFDLYVSQETLSVKLFQIFFGPTFIYQKKIYLGSNKRWSRLQTHYLSHFIFRIYVTLQEYVLLHDTHTGYANINRPQRDVKIWMPAVEMHISTIK